MGQIVRQYVVPTTTCHSALGGIYPSPLSHLPLLAWLATSFEISHFALIKSDLIKATSRSLRQTLSRTLSPFWGVPATPLL